MIAPRPFRIVPRQPAERATSCARERAQAEEELKRLIAEQASSIARPTPRRNAARCRHPGRPQWSAGHTSIRHGEGVHPILTSPRPLATSRTSSSFAGLRPARTEIRTTAPLRPTMDRGSGLITALPTGFWRPLRKISRSRPARESTTPKSARHGIPPTRHAAGDGSIRHAGR
jgi:hypothetical protein